MLVPFAIDIDSLMPDLAWTPSDVGNHLKSLLRVWRSFGLLHHDGPDLLTSRLKAAVDKLPSTNLRSDLKSALMELPLCACGDSWTGSVSAAALIDLCGVVQLALVDDDRAEVGFDMSEEAQSVSVDDIEICRIKCAENALSFDVARDMADARINRGLPYGETWATRFRSLAKAPIKRITIVDRYAVEQHLVGERDKLRAPTDRRRWPADKRSGLARFLMELDRDATGPRYITLYSSHTKDLLDMGTSLGSVADELGRTIRELPNRRIEKLTIYLSRDNVFRDLAHGRYVRFDRYIWDLDLGLKVLEGQFAPAACKASFKTGKVRDDYMDDEALLRNHATTLKADARL